MPPFDISSLGVQASHADLLHELSTSESFKEIPTHGSRSKGSNRLHSFLWASSPVTPWENDTNLNQKRKLSTKASIRNAKNSKNNTKDSRKKNKKDLKKRVGLSAISAKTNANKTKEHSNTFRHHSDVSEYMRDYRKSKNMTPTEHNDSSYRGVYGNEDIDKAYENLDIPNFAKRKRSVFSYSKTVLPPVKAASEICQLSSKPYDVNSEMSPEESAHDQKHDHSLNHAAGEEIETLDDTLPDDQEKLPTVSLYALQDTSDLGQLRLSTSATREDFPKIEKGRDSTAAKPKSSHLFLSNKRPQTKALHLQKNRMIAFSLPEGCLMIDNNIYNIQDNHKIVGACEIVEHDLDTGTQSSESCFSSVSTFTSEQKRGAFESQDDALELVETANFSSQSSVLLSNAGSYLDSSCSSYSNLTRTTRKKLRTHIKDLHPFSRNGKRFHDVQKRTENLSKSMHDQTVSDQVKQLVSLKTYQKLSRKSSMRKFIEELYIPDNEKQILESNDASFLTGKQLQKSTFPSSFVLPSLESKNRKEAPTRKKETVNNLHIDTTKQVKQPIDLCKKKNTIRPIQRIVTLEKRRVTKPAKFAVTAKCRALDKQPVSVRGVAL